MVAVERNWLIRTKENQILGPVSKQKIVEFLNKGALSDNDELSSGNGYWIYIRESELINRYLVGDVPQSFNPISEAKTVLSIKENPNTTTSLNLSPANLVFAKTENEREIDDVTLVTHFNKDILKNLSESNAKLEDVKAPSKDDLEFPDVDVIRNSITIESSFESTSVSEGMSDKKSHLAVDTKEPISSEPLVYPNEDDLSFPDMQNVHASSDDIHFELKVEVPQMQNAPIVANVIETKLQISKNTHKEHKTLLQDRRAKISNQSQSRDTSMVVKNF
jgi:hypothetical protein